MKVLVIALNDNVPERQETAKNVFEVNFANAGYKFETLHVNEFGISKAINVGLQHALDNNFDAVVTMANDIIMPNNWLRKMVEYSEAIPGTGALGIHTVEHKYNPRTINGLDLYLVACAFGNNFIPIDAIKAVGFFNTDYDPYGTQDHDYSYRLSAAGFYIYYIDSTSATHVGHDMGSGTEYRKMKDESLVKSQEKFQKWILYYEKNGVYLKNK